MSCPEWWTADRQLNNRPNQSSTKPSNLPLKLACTCTYAIIDSARPQGAYRANELNCAASLTFASYGPCNATELNLDFSSVHARRFVRAFRVTVSKPHRLTLTLDQSRVVVHSSSSSSSSLYSPKEHSVTNSELDSRAGQHGSKKLHW